MPSLMSSSTMIRDTQISSTIHQQNEKEPLISKKHVRRKSCCCSFCGGISPLERRTIDIVITKEEGKPGPAILSTLNSQRQHDSATPGKDK